MFTGEERARMGAMWLAHLQGWRASGISLAEYARREGFDADGAYRWKRILRRTGQWVEAPAAAVVKSTQRSSPVQFARVAVNDGPPPAGMPLAGVEGEAERFLKLSRGMNFPFAEAAAIGQLLLLRELRGDRSAGTNGASELPRVEAFEQQLGAAGADMRIPQILHWIRQLQARYHSQDYAAALDLDRKIRAELEVNRSFIEPGDYHFYAALTHTAAFDTASTHDQPHHRAEVDFHLGKLEEWARSCPANFQARATLVTAEIARTRLEKFKALCLFEEAALQARHHGLLNLQAMAAELTAMLLIGSDCPTSADVHLRVAHDCYARWGAQKIAQRLERTYPQLLAKPAQATGTGASSISLGELDMAAVVQMSQAVSSEIVIERLIERLMITLVEHAGAVRGLLFLPRDGQIQLVAEAFATGSGIQVDLLNEIDLRGRLPLSVLNYVSRTQETVRIVRIASSEALLNDFVASPEM